MTGNYQNVNVSVVEWGPESEPGMPDDKFTRELEEMYVDNGSLVFILGHPDGEQITDIKIPIQPKGSWNEFVESLPTWKLE